MDRKAMAQETLEIMRRGYYTVPQGRISIKEDMERSIQGSLLITPAEGEKILEACKGGTGAKPEVRVENISTVEAVRTLAAEGKTGIGVLNFASAKNPGGGFLNGAMAQEESLAASGGLYRTLTPHEGYYRRNRACGTMMYTGCAIYSPGVVFFRDGEFRLVQRPVTASVLTLPAVNLGQVLQKGEDPARARVVMKERMRRALRLFGAMGAQSLVLGAYGCGVFRNDPRQVARWWRELLAEPAFADRFPRVVFAVLDGSRSQSCRAAFWEELGPLAKEG